MSVPFLDLRRAHAELGGELRSAFDRVMQSGQYVLGEELELFEHEFARFSGTRHAIGVGNGLDALTIALRSIGIGVGDEVIVPVHTFIATWLAVTQCGAEIVPVDVDPDRLLIDFDQAAAAITPRTAAIVPVHLYGHPVDLGPLSANERFAGIPVIGDAAQAHGGAVNGRPVGALGTAAAFSFYPSKNLGAIGDGGAITTADDELADRARSLRNYGSRSKYDFRERGVNSRLDPLQAAFLRAKLAVLPDWNRRRQLVAARYFEMLAGVPDLTLPASPPPELDHVWHNFCVRHPKRDELREHLAKRGINTAIHYPVPPHRTRAFASLNLKAGTFPISESAAETVLSLPMGPHLDEESVTAVVDAVRAFPR